MAFGWLPSSFIDTNEHSKQKRTEHKTKNRFPGMYRGVGVSERTEATETRPRFYITPDRPGWANIQVQYRL